MTLYVCSGYWKDEPTDSRFSRFEQMIVSDQEWDGLEDWKDEKIFHYTDGNPVIGDQGDFVITEAEVYPVEYF